MSRAREQPRVFRCNVITARQCLRGDVRLLPRGRDLVKPTSRGEISSQIRSAMKTVALLVLALLGCASAQVTVLNGDNFDATVLKSGKNAIVKFYAPWCGHCKALAPAWNELGDFYAGSSSVIVGDVDCTVNEDLCGQFEVRGYPTLKYFNAETGTAGGDYQSGRDLDSLKAFVDENLEMKCSVTDQERCTEKEVGYIEKMRGKSADEVAAALKRLEGMRDGSMKPELKQWMVQRINILNQLTEA
jgi:protein disulfide-isomerase A6